MRALSYRLMLNSDYGYVISNAKQPELCGGVSSEEVWAPGIKMTVRLPDKDVDTSIEGNLSLDEFLDQFMYDNGNPDFEKCYRRTLCGEKTGWELAQVKVHCGYLLMEFVSKQRFKELREEGDDGESPYFNEGLLFSPNKYGAGLFRFEVERPDGLAEIYEMTVGRSRTFIRERIGDQLYIVDFDGKEEGEGEWVDITWYR